MTKFIRELKGRGQRKQRIDQNIDKSQEGYWITTKFIAELLGSFQCINIQLYHKP